MDPGRRLPWAGWVTEARALADYMELSLQLQFNERSARKKETGSSSSA